MYVVLHVFSHRIEIQTYARAEARTAAYGNKLMKLQVQSSLQVTLHKCLSNAAAPKLTSYNNVENTTK